MQVFYPPAWVMLILFFVFWFLFQAGSAFLCFQLPNDFFSKDNALFRQKKWEKDGKIYQKIFRIRSWKGLLPDGGAMLKGGYAKKHLTDTSKENMELFLIESRRAELTHWLGILPFWFFGLFSPQGFIWIMLGYALVVNLPCILAQRYNRPRIQKLLNKQKVSKKQIIVTTNAKKELLVEEWVFGKFSL